MKLTETNLYKATKTWVDYMTEPYNPKKHEAANTFDLEEKMLADMVAAVKEAKKQEVANANAFKAACRGSIFDV